MAPRATPEIVRLTLADAGAWARMRADLWPDEDADILRKELNTLLDRDDTATFGARLPSGDLVGFIEVGTRSVAEDCETSPVGYIEGLWVDAGARKQGIARKLVEAAIDWSRNRGYQELASDTQIWNTLSHAVHKHLGFAETERLVTFRMDLRKP